MNEENKKKEIAELETSVEKTRQELTAETEAKACGVKGGTGEVPSLVGGANITL